MHPNENTATVLLKTEDLLQIIKEHGNAVDVVSIDRIDGRVRQSISISLILIIELFGNAW